MKIPPDRVKRKSDEVVDSVPPDNGFEVLDGEVTDEKRDKNNSENFADSDDAHNLLKWRVIKCNEGWKIPRSAI